MRALVSPLALLGVLAAAPIAHGRPQAGGADSGTTLPAASAADEQKERAKALFQRGIEAYKAGRYKDAIDAFLDAHTLYPNPVLSFNAARAYEKLGDRAGALRFYREYLRQSPDASDRADAEQRIGALETALRERGVQQVTILSSPEGATVVIDERPVGVTPWTGEIFPGKHQLEVRRDGYAPHRSAFELPAHRAIDVSATLEPTVAELAPAAAPAAPPPPAPPLSASPPPRVEAAHGGVQPLTWVALGIGAAGLGSGVAFELMRQSSEDAVKSERTQVARGDAFDEMESRQTTARILFGIGAAASVAGGVLLYLDLSRGAPAARSEARLGAGCAGVRCGLELTGRF